MNAEQALALLGRAELEVRDREGKGERISLDLSLREGMGVLAMIQLALRHPEARQVVTAKQAYAIASLISEVLSRSPALAEVCGLGWDSSADV